MPYQAEEKRIFPLFSTPVFQTNIKGFENDIIDLDNIPSDLYYRNSQQGKTFNSISNNILLETGFEKIRQTIDEVVGEYVYGILKLPLQSRLKLTNSWAVIGLPNAITSDHIHENSLFSGVFYVKSEKGAGDLRFTIPFNIPTYSTSTVRPKPVEYNVYNSPAWTFSPKTNDVFVFPSHLYHGVSANLSGQKRCCIAFNYFLTGEISDRSTNVLTL